MNLYWVDNAIYKLYNKFTNPDTGELQDYTNPKTGETIPADRFIEELERLNMKKEDIIENTGLMIKRNKADIKAIEDEIKALHERKKALERQTERLEQDAADALQGEPFRRPKVEFTWRRSTIATSDDESIAPDEYMNITITKKPNKNEIKKALKAEKEVEGWRLVTKNNMSVK